MSCNRCRPKPPLDPSGHFIFDTQRNRFVKAVYEDAFGKSMILAKDLEAAWKFLSRTEALNSIPYEVEKNRYIVLSNA